MWPSLVEKKACADYKSGLGLVEIARAGAVKRGPRERSDDKGSALRVRGHRTFVSS